LFVATKLDLEIKQMDVKTTKFDLEIKQMDVKTTFPHGDLKEEIYMTQL